MGIISDTKENNPEYNQNNNQNYNNQMNIAVQVESIEDNKFIIGTRLDTQEKVKVYLRDLKKEPTGKYKRPDVSKLYNNVKNGILKFELCYIDSEGNYSSRWGKVLSNNPEETTVSIAKASVYYGKAHNSEDEYVQIAVAYQKHKRSVSNLNEVKDVLEKFLQPKTQGSKPFVFVKLSDGEDTEVIRVYGKTEKNDDQINVTLSGEESVKSFFESDRSKLLVELIDNEKITVEIIPARVIYPGSNYKEKLLETGFIRDILSTKFKANVDDQNKPQGLGFLNCIISTRTHADGTPFVIDITPIGSDEAILPEDL